MDVDDVLQNWWEAKKKVEKLNLKVEKYKKAVDTLMERKETKTITGKEFTVQKRNGARTYITKNNVPSDIWTKYATRCTYESFYLTKNR